MIETEMIEKPFVAGEWVGAAASGAAFDAANPKEETFGPAPSPQGMVAAGPNDGMPSTAQALFGGLKESGVGREGGHQGIEEYLDTKYVSLGGIGAT